MNSKPRFPDYLYGICALIGGTMGVISVYITVILLPSLPPAVASVASLLLGGGDMDPGSFYFITAISGAISGIVIGRIGYLIKPWKGVSIGGAILGGALVPILFFSMINFEALFGNVSETIADNRLQRMYPEPKPIPTLQANFQELARGRYYGIMCSEHRLFTVGFGVE